MDFSSQLLEFSIETGEILTLTVSLNQFGSRSIVAHRHHPRSQQLLHTSPDFPRHLHHPVLHLTLMTNTHVSRFRVEQPNPNTWAFCCQLSTTLLHETTRMRTWMHIVLKRLASTRVREGSLVHTTKFCMDKEWVEDHEVQPWMHFYQIGVSILQLLMQMSNNWIEKLMGSRTMDMI